MLGLSTLLSCLVVPVALLFHAGPLCGQETHPGALQQRVSQEKAVELAERFVRDNGYTDAPDSAIKAELDAESMEGVNDRTEMLELRRNTLQTKAIGVKATSGGWGVAFDYVSHPGTCRVVAMDKNGTRIRMEHKDGIRAYWLGSAER